MELAFLMFLGAGIWSRRFVQFQIFGIEMIYLCIFALLCYYVYEVIVKRRLKIRKAEWLWFAFIAYGVIRVGLSLLGITGFIVSDKLAIDLHYLPRQAYYLALLPVVLLTEQSKGKKQVYDLVQKHSRVLFCIVLLLSVFDNRSFVFSNTQFFLLAFLSLQNEKRDWIDWLIFAMLVVPVFLLGIQNAGFTALLILFIYAVCFLFQRRSKLVLCGMAAGIWCCVGLCFAAAVFAEELGQVISDPNSIWRAQFWADELRMMAESRFLGVGYGTAYCSTDFVDPAVHIPWGIGGPFSANAHYSTHDKVFITGAHSSFVTIAFRLGIVGIVLFAGYLIWLHAEQLKNLQAVSIRSYFALCSSVVIIALNVGLESPYYFLLFLFSVYWSSYEVKNGVQNTSEKQIHNNSESTAVSQIK